jgi:hypothetical protein
MREAILWFERLVALETSMERESLCGSAYKRLARLEASAKRPGAERRAIERMQAHYERAESLGREGQLDGFFYPALNRIAAELVIEGGRRGWSGLDPDALAAVRRTLARQVRDDPDFWSVAGQIELHVYEAVARRALARARPAVEAAYADLHARVPAPWMWASVRDQARFVLLKYVSRTTPAEARAARALLGQLDLFQVRATADANA